MTDFFGILILLSFFLLVVGLIKPSLFKNRKTGLPYSRGQLSLVFSLMVIFSFVLFGIVTPTPESKQIQKESTANLEQKNQVSDDKQIPAEEKSISLDGLAEKKLIKFIEAIKRRDWNSAAEYTQLTWQSNKTQKEKAEYIRLQFDSVKMKSYKIISKDKDSEAFKTYTVHVEGINLLNAAVTFEMNPNVICEIGMRQPDPNGEWGVNPASAIMHQL